MNQYRTSHAYSLQIYVQLSYRDFCMSILSKIRLVINPKVVYLVVLQIIIILMQKIITILMQNYRKNISHDYAIMQLHIQLPVLYKKFPFHLEYAGYPEPVQPGTILKGLASLEKPAAKRFSLYTNMVMQILSTVKPLQIIYILVPNMYIVIVIYTINYA